MKKTVNKHDLVTGDARTLVVSLSLNGAPFSIPVDTQVRALIQDVGMSPVSCSAGDAGAVWGSSVVAVPLTAEHTALLTPTVKHTLEIQVAGFGTWFADNIEVRRGQIG
ncbi:MAG: hypothetical protein HC933_09710 [Pleurocapsa sp. SU_196_0]|nr:hypothetical protein [Pleurocapsa sp. SU_196_0]